MQYSKSRMMCRVAFCVSLALAGKAHAETLAQALTKAYLANPALKTYQWQVRDAFEGRKRLEASSWLPSVSGKIAVGRKDETSYGVPNPNTGALDKNNNSANPLSTSIDISQPLFNPDGGNINDLRAVSESVQSSIADYINKEQAFLREAIEVYLVYTRTQAALKVTQSQVNNFEQDQHQKKIEFDLGAAARTELSRVESRLADARGGLAKAEAELEKARADYVRLFGSVPGDLDMPALPQDSLRTATLEQVMALAEKNNPTLKQAQAGLRQSDASVQASHMRLLPRVSLDGSISMSRAGLDLDAKAIDSEGDYQHVTSVMATMTVPLYSPTTYSQIRTSVIKQVSSRLGLETSRRLLRKEVTTDFYALKAAEAEVKQYEISVKAAKDALEGTRLEAEMGARTFLDVLLSETDLQTVHLKLLEAQQKYLLSYYEIKRVCGELTPHNLKMQVPVFNPQSDYHNNASWLGFKGAHASADTGVSTLMQDVPSVKTAK